MKKTVQQVANWLQQEAVNGQQEWITGVSINTRTLQP